MVDILKELESAENKRKILYSVAFLQKKKDL